VGAFGDEHESAQLLKEIKKKTGKSPLIDKEAKKYTEQLIKTIIRYRMDKEFLDELDDIKNTYDYYFLRKILRSRTKDVLYYETKDRAEIPNLIYQLIDLFNEKYNERLEVIKNGRKH
jgi:hypothetical protein